MGPIETFVLLLVAGLLLITVEVFTPGMVMGLSGAACLVGAIVMGFKAFPAAGPYVAAGIILLVVAMVMLWMKFLPNSRIGRKLTVSQDLAKAKAVDTEKLHSLVGQEGTADSELRPAGFARIGGRRVDVVTRGEMVPKGTAIRVVQIDGIRVVVTRTEKT